MKYLDKTKNMDLLNWIESWYKSQCDGDWEHQFGVEISNIDNPGWQVKIDLAFTELELLNINYELVEKSDNDWYGFTVKDKLYKGVGDPSKLSLKGSKSKKKKVK
jgi:hypothetical protein